MKVELCAFSGFKIYPGHGKRYVKSDGRVFNFITYKCQASMQYKKNPRKIAWTVLYRRKHNKGKKEEVSRKRTTKKKTYNASRAIAGLTSEQLKKKMNEAPALREANRQAAIMKTKDEKRKKTVAKMSIQKATTRPAKQKVSKNVSKQTPRVPVKR